MVQPGDIVFNRLRTWQGGLGVSNYSGIVSPAYIVCRPKPSVEPQFLHYVLRSQPCLAELTRLSKFMPPSQFDILWDDLRRMPIVLPGKLQQRAICDFLDAETARIDALVAKKRRLIKLSELRVLTETVERTCQRQIIVPLRRVAARLQTGTTPVAEAQESGPEDRKIEWLSPADFGATLTIRKAARHLPEKAIHEQSAPLFPAGSIVIVGIGATAGRVGCLDRDASGNQQLTCVIPMSQVDGRFLAWQLLGRTREMRETAPYTTLPILNNDFLRALPVNLPPFDEQQRIARELDALAGRTRNLINTLERQIELLKEHRQALIVAAVTGEMDVPGAPT